MKTSMQSFHTYYQWPRKNWNYILIIMFIFVTKLKKNHTLFVLVTSFIKKIEDIILIKNVDINLCKEVNHYVIVF